MSLKLHGLRISYYTGKMEAYLRYKEIPFEFVTLNPERMRRLRRQTGAAQMPAVELADGRYMTDTTPMIEWFEETHAEHPVLPDDVVLRVLAFLLEDYAEEWLWRPAMHYRWSYASDRAHLGRLIADELLAGVRQPAFLKRAFIRRRQLGQYVRGDGVNARTRLHVESIYLRTLDRLEAIFAKRPFLLGARPSLADFGFFASMFRHFSQDPTASAIMRERAPGVLEWQARLWNARGSAYANVAWAMEPSGVDELLADVATAYLPYLNDNARAWQARQTHFDPQIEGVPYAAVPVSQYRVWCLEQLQGRVTALAGPARADVEAMLQRYGCLAPLFEIEVPCSRYDEGAEAPFRGRKVHYQNRRD